MKKLIILFISLLIAGNVYGADSKLEDLTEDATPALSSLMYNVTSGSADRKSTLGQMFSAGTDLDANGVISANSVALTTDTTGNYAGGDAEAGSALTGDAAVDFFGAGVTAVTDATTCTDIEGTKLSITGTTLNVTETDSVVGAITGLVKANGAGTIAQAVAGTDYLVANQTITLSGDVTGSGTTSIASTIGNDKILEVMLKSVNEPTDEYALTYESTTGDFEWVELTGGAEINNLQTVCTDIATTEIPIGTAADTVVYAALSGGATMANDGVVTIVTNANLTGEVTSVGNATTIADSIAVTNWNLTTPVLGTPQSGTLTNCTGLPAASVVAGTLGTGNYVFDGTITAPTEITLAVDGKLEFNPTPSATDKATGTIVSMTVDVNTVGIGGALHMDTDSHWVDADMNATTSMPCMALALGTTGTVDVLLNGIIKDTGWSWTVGGIMYVNTSGTLTQTAPSGDGDQVQVVGIALSADTIIFNPSGVLVEVVV